MDYVNFIIEPESIPGNYFTCYTNIFRAEAEEWIAFNNCKWKYIYDKVKLEGHRPCGIKFEKEEDCLAFVLMFGNKLPR